VTALVATLGAALYGLADFLGGVASRRDSALSVTITAQAVGFVCLLLLSVFFPPRDWGDPLILWGVAAGALGGTGVLALYAGLATGRMSVVAPITAALAAAVPAGVSLAAGTRLSWTALAGMVLAFVAVIIVSVFAEDEGHGDARKALVFAIISGLGFGASILCWAQTPASTSFAPLAAARITSVTIFVIAALLFRGGRIMVAPQTRALAVATGVVDVLANSAQVISLRMGPVALAAVLGALYPIGTVLLARFVLHEHLRGWQRVGIVMALVAVILCAIP
jgi:drug/metabolite transporter (DMT)-like permease